MTTEEKLAHCVKFIERIRDLTLTTCYIEDLVTLSGHCQDCNSTDVQITVNGNDEVYDPNDINSLKDDAWHVLADITD